MQGVCPELLLIKAMRCIMDVKMGLLVQDQALVVQRLLQVGGVMGGRGQEAGVGWDGVGWGVAWPAHALYWCM